MTTVTILNQSESVEWYTPARYVEAARNLLGGIDLDPASCRAANKIVKASMFFTPEIIPLGDDSPGITADGLTEPWHVEGAIDEGALPARVFLNPPYGRLTAAEVPERMRDIPAVAQMLKTFHKVSSQFIWSWYALEEYRAGRVRSAILLVNNVPSESWFAPFKHFPICDTDHRIKFISPVAASAGGNGGAGGTPAGLRHPRTLPRAADLSVPPTAGKKKKKMQPTKGQSVIFLPDIAHFRLPPGHDRCSELAFVPHDDWTVEPSIAAFIGEFARFGFIYLPNELALQMRALHRSRKVVAV